jgi:hypothetical protein
LGSHANATIFWFLSGSSRTSIGQLGSFTRKSSNPLYVDFFVLVWRSTLTAKYSPDCCQCIRTSDTLNRFLLRISRLLGSSISATRAGWFPPPCSGWYTDKIGSAGDQQKSKTPSSLTDFLSTSVISGASYTLTWFFPSFAKNAPASLAPAHLNTGHVSPPAPTANSEMGPWNERSFAPDRTSKKLTRTAASR